ncbi:MAG: MerR family transcriptional regulator [Actinomycetota bacterium]
MTRQAASDADDPLMPIGMFSRASLVSVKALRNYHEQGLLIPSEIDATSGYRSYRVSQLTDATIIKRLRDLDVPLRDVAEVVRARDPEITAKVLTEHEAIMRRRLDDVSRIVHELQQAVEYPSLSTPVHVRDEPAVHALAASGEVDEAEYATFLADAYGRLWQALATTGATMAGPSAARYPAHVDTEREPIEAYLPITEAVPVPQPVLDTDVYLTLIPAAHCAVMTHVGGYDTIGDTYRQLGAWVARHATTIDQPVREHYVVSVDMATGALLPSEQLRTEISWPIERSDTSSSAAAAAGSEHES